MKQWEKPSAIDLGFKQTAGNPATKGNDAVIPDCIEDVLEDIFGDHSGPCSKPSPTHSC